MKPDNDHEILTHPSGNTRKSRIRVQTGDRVPVETAPDLTCGRIVFRFK